MVAWPATSPSAIEPPTATATQRHPVPTWLPAASRPLFSQGLQAQIDTASLQTAAPKVWLPAYCAHAIPNFCEDHLHLGAKQSFHQSSSSEPPW